MLKKLFILNMTKEASDSDIPRLTVEDWTLLQARLMWCYEGEVSAEYRRRRTERSHLSAWGVLAGTATARRGRKVWRAGAGEWLLAGPEGFEQEFSAEARIVSVNFRLEWPSGDALVGGPLVISADGAAELEKEAGRLVRFVGRTFPKARTELWQQAAGLEEFFGLQQVFSGWVVAYLRAVLAAGVVPVRMRGLEPRVREVLRRLDKRKLSEPFREKEVAEEAGLSAGHLDRLFGRDLGVTPRAYLQKRRLRAALEALADRTVPVKQVAFELGFGSASHFCHWVKKATGKSPRAHRMAA